MPLNYRTVDKLLIILIPFVGDAVSDSIKIRSSSVISRTFAESFAKCVPKL